jgi:hypothetical protein
MERGLLAGLAGLLVCADAARVGSNAIMRRAVFMPEIIDARIKP